MKGVAFLEPAAEEIRLLDRAGQVRALSAVAAIVQGRLVGQPLLGQAQAPLFKACPWHFVIIYLVLADQTIVVTEITSPRKRALAERVDEAVAQLLEVPDDQRAPFVDSLVRLARTAPSTGRDLQHLERLEELGRTS